MLEIIVLAAGRGTRMCSDLPKVLHPLAGRPMLVHVLDTARKLRPAALRVVVGHGAEAVESVAGSDVSLHLQREQLGTGHAVMQALPACDETSTVLVLYGDVPLMSADTLQKLVDRVDAAPAMLSTVLEDPTGYGRVIRDGVGRFAAVVEHKDADAAQRAVAEVNTGVLAAPARLLSNLLGRVDNHNAQAEFYLPDVLALAVADGMTVAVETTVDATETLGVNDRAQMAALERAYQARQADALLAAGVALADPGRIDIRGSLQCGRDVSIDINAVFEGEVVLGDGVRIGPNCVLRDVQVGPGTEISAFSHLDGAVLAADCRIGPFARLRPGSDLAEGVRIGNFVETKNAVFGTGSKANHLAYVGDAQVGSGCNIGAGTITCNYDGARKHRTVLGDGVFVGSNSTLVAPLEIADGGFVAAGSTLTKPVAADQLALGRARQRNIDGWQRPRKDKD